MFFLAPKGPSINDLTAFRQLPPEAFSSFAQELRQELLCYLDQSGGHLASNLGCVELTMALHWVFDSPHDRIFFDTGHQAYVHKLLTGRRGQFSTLRKKGGLAPFPHHEESPHDPFCPGHGGTALSTAMGCAWAHQLLGKSQQVIAVLGDAALNSGMTLEAFNQLSETTLNLLVIINDNGYSISRTVGGPHFWKSALDRFNVYREPLDGHDTCALIERLRHAASLPGPRLLWLQTQKGKGYLPAELDPVAYHSVAPGFLKTGKQSLEKPSTISSLSFTAAFSRWVEETASVVPHLAVICPAMTESSGLRSFALAYPERFYDTGMAEQHALGLAAGLAAQGWLPIVAIYSTFLQRAFDQIIHDLALPGLKVILAIDRAGIVGPDGPTHAGIFDLAVLRMIPGITVMLPADEHELRGMFNLALTLGLCAIRYPKADCLPSVGLNFSAVERGKASLVRKGKQVALVTSGSLVETALAVGNQLDASVVSLRFAVPLDVAFLKDLFAEHNLLIVVEETPLSGGLGEAILAVLNPLPKGKRVVLKGLSPQFPTTGTREEILSDLGLDQQGIQQFVEEQQKLKEVEL